jgi:hypothetical protein
MLIKALYSTSRGYIRPDNTCETEGAEHILKM